MAWKRGVQNNQPGLIRKGHIKEFIQPSSRDLSISHNFKILNFDDDILSPKIREIYQNYPLALICSFKNGFPDEFIEFLSNDQVILLHAHEYPTSVLSCVISDDVPYGCIVLKDFQLVNCKVCISQNQLFTVYQGEQFKYDNREGAIGDTLVRFKELLPLQTIRVSVNPRNTTNDNLIPLDETLFSREIGKLLYNCVITIEEVYIYLFDDNNFVVRIEVVEPEELSQAIDEENDITLPDYYRGIITASTQVIIQDHKAITLINRLNSSKIQEITSLKNIVYILTNDKEVFPVKRRLLRPCIALTSIVQAGRGKYSLDNNQIDEKVSQMIVTTEEKQELIDIIDEEYYEQELIKVAIDACTFDRVLLYLEHEANNDIFHFDPLIANDLKDAAIILKITGLNDLCDKVLGSFQERVRKTPISFHEVMTRNNNGTIDPKTGKRKETWIIMSGMVFDISRWLDEHPGGSSIIPSQALNVDSTIFFEIYHASRQSFLYLKEFYIGELSIDDLDQLPLPTSYTGGTKASAAFIEQLRRMTPWRLQYSDLKPIQSFKSF